MLGSGRNAHHDTRREPLDPDTDGDTVPGIEDSGDDSDGDTISDADEHLGWVNPDGTVSGTDPTDDDTDNDG